MSDTSNVLLNTQDVVVASRFFGEVLPKPSQDEALFHGVDSISISLASPSVIRGWSFGEVTSSETINYRTHKQESEGLFSQMIFGPVKDCECLCGKYSKQKYRGITCDKCFVEVCDSRVRRERLGHIELKCKVVHPLFVRRANSPIAILLSMSFAEIEKIMYHESYMVLDPGITKLKMFQTLSEAAYEKAMNDYGETAFRVSSGGDALFEALSRMDMNKEIEAVRVALEETKSEAKQRILLRRLGILMDFMASGNRPEWMILECIPVSPPDLRPLVQHGGRFFSADTNELYKRVLNRNERLGRMYAARAPELIIRNEQRMLQESVDALFDNSKKAVVAKSAQGRPLKSLAEALKGKHGRFRQNLLGKRVDYSGRAVIIAGPHLKVHECGLPEVMAYELFKPFILGRLVNLGHAGSLRAAKKMIERQAPEAFEILKEVVKDHPVLLNRAPTLHKLNIQAFIPRIINTKALQLHPLVCTAFNADFDGDQMAIHVPLSIEAQMEAWVLMLSANNVKNPQNGKPIHVPTKDMVVGMYMMTAPAKDDARRGRSFASFEDAMIAYENDVIGIGTMFKYRFKYDGQSVYVETETTLGRLIIYRSLPQDGKIPFEAFNTVITSKKIADLMSLVDVTYGQRVLVEFADAIKELGFEYGTRSGLSFGKDDMVVPLTKQKHISETFEKIKVAERQYADGHITDRERYNQVTDRWAECADRIGSDMMKELEKTKDTTLVNSCYVMSVSGARATFGVLHQLGGMRGLLATSSGKVLDTPVTSNFKEGLSGSEYFLSVCGARKGLSDTALKTATAGYLTRRLADVSQDYIITSDDCGATEGLTYTVQMDGGRILKPLSSLIMGRVLCEPLRSNSGKVVLSRGEIITPDKAQLIDASSALSAKVRSPVRCVLRDGICSSCYGVDLSSGKLVSVGEVVGILAAQSIGEPGAQLTMRTFHVGGTTSRAVAKPVTSSSCDGIVQFIGVEVVTNQQGEKIVVSPNSFVAINDDSGVTLARFSVVASAKLFIEEGQKIKTGDPICERDPYNDYIVSEYNGVIRLEDFVPNVSYKEKIDEETGTSRKVIVDWLQADRSLTPRVVICDEKTGQPLQNVRTAGIANYILSVDTIVTLKNGDIIKKGDSVARVTREGSGFVKDITGGLPRVEELFEARSPKTPALIAEIDGVVRFMSDYRLKNQLVIEAHDESKTVKYAVAKGRRLRVQEGSLVKKGDILADGSSDPHAILAVNGVDATASFLVDEVQQIYRLQGVVIDDKHIEVIIRAMLSKVEITDRGDSAFVHLQQYERCEVEDQNSKLIAENKRPAKYIDVLQGITRASIQDRSFISSASFQETMKVLVNAAVAGRRDLLTGMKENVIIGSLIPGGTGFATKRFKSIGRSQIDVESLDGEVTNVDSNGNV